MEDEDYDVAGGGGGGGEDEREDERMDSGEAGEVGIEDEFRDAVERVKKTLMSTIIELRIIGDNNDVFALMDRKANVIDVTNKPVSEELSMMEPLKESSNNSNNNSKGSNNSKMVEKLVMEKEALEFALQSKQDEQVKLVAQMAAMSEKLHSIQIDNKRYVELLKEGEKNVAEMKQVKVSIEKKHVSILHYLQQQNMTLLQTKSVIAELSHGLPARQNAFILKQQQIITDLTQNLQQSRAEVSLLTEKSEATSSILCDETEQLQETLSLVAACKRQIHELEEKNLELQAEKKKMMIDKEVFLAEYCASCDEINQKSIATNKEIHAKVQDITSKSLSIQAMFMAATEKSNEAVVKNEKLQQQVLQLQEEIANLKKQSAV